MKKTVISLLLGLSAAFGYAQTAYDALLFSENDYEGTARSVAMGNAFTALGGDLGSIGINPAGSAVAGYSQFTLSFWNEILDHPDYDSYWKERSLENHLNDIKPAILVVGGTFDTDDCYGALNTYKIISDESPQTDIHFVYGPWSHGAWHDYNYTGLGEIEEWGGLSEYFMKNIEYPFFRYYLEGKGDRPEPVYISSSGSDSWQTMAVWPADDVDYTPLYLHEDKSLSFTEPAEVSSFSTYRSDPDNPVPFMEDASSRDNSYMVADQSFASIRKDVLTFTSEAQNEIMKLEGPVKVNLNLSISTDDADVIVKLIDHQVRSCILKGKHLP